MAVVGVTQLFRSTDSTVPHGIGVAVGYLGYGLCWPSTYLSETWVP